VSGVYCAMRDADLTDGVSPGSEAISGVRQSQAVDKN
jgi:hypothetical protein